MQKMSGVGNRLNEKIKLLYTSSFDSFIASPEKTGNLLYTY